MTHLLTPALRARRPSQPRGPHRAERVTSGLAATLVVAAAVVAAPQAAAYAQGGHTTLPDGRACLPGAQVAHVTLATGVERHRCETAAMPGSPLPIAHGPELLEVQAPCASALVRIERYYVRGVQTGDEQAQVDGRPLYWLARLDGRVAGLVVSAQQPATTRPAVAWTTSRVGKSTCMGLHVCGKPTGYAECLTPKGYHRGSFVGGVPEGPGERLDRSGVRLLSTFSGGEPHGVTTRVARDGTRFTSLFIHGKAQGLGFTEFARGERRAAHYEAGKRHGRAVWTSRKGRRSVSLWHAGRKLHERPEPQRALGAAAAPEPSRPARILWAVERADDGGTTLHTWLVGPRSAVALASAKAELKARGTVAQVRRANAPRGYPMAIVELRSAQLSKHRRGRFAHVDHGMVGAAPEVQDEAPSPVVRRGAQR